MDTEKISPEHMAQLAEASQHLDAANRAATSARDAAVGAQAVLLHVSKQLREVYKIGPNDQLSQDGSIVRGAAGV